DWSSDVCSSDLKKLSEVNIKKLFPSHIYRGGLDYYKRDRVNDLVYDINNQVWTAMVQGTENYFVEIDMRQYEKGTINTDCECPAFETYGSCKHIAATLIAISNKDTEESLTSNTYNYDY